MVIDEYMAVYSRSQRILFFKYKIRILNLVFGKSVPSLMSLEFAIDINKIITI